MTAATPSPAGAAPRPAAFTLSLLDGHRAATFDDATSLVAADATGQFGIQPGHGDFITVLEPGLLRYRRASAPGWAYAAGLGGLLACHRSPAGSAVRIVSGRFLFGDQPEALQARLDELLAREHALRVSTRESQVRLDLALVKRLQQLAESRA